MKIAKLVEMLQQYEPDTEVLCYEGEYMTYYEPEPIFDFAKQSKDGEWQSSTKKAKSAVMIVRL